ncbi:23S rRNA (adenine(1618)-N(6))-methyltransferase RlmF [uncultured Acinetobacter sp.]|uniref:23S rRNA (adenine(1618)-N(6))-methyltransferase RlmF n=1 Tax=uncultured Acinetobacter sp. TaxID=165433 RepID=UPI0026299A1F|nr:23S rRNA (adenine(1618)-N(6))-methyltransferase RlmF [uncultured Acinetobacter sp.]
MAQAKKSFPQQKSQLHARNLHRSRYDFPQLIKSCPELAPFVRPNPYGDLSINFSDPNAVKMLNKALLKHFYGIDYWDIPKDYLCPPIPGRADYIHYLADVLSLHNNGQVPTGPKIQVLDIGVGANCIYPIIGRQSYGWKFVGSDIHAASVKSAQFIVQANPNLSKAIQIRLQKTPSHIFQGVIKPSDRFDITLCNPPFHASQDEANATATQKLKKLGKALDKTKVVLNFGGQKNELWCDGGEARFVCQMVQESTQFAEQCLWFSTLVSKKTTLPLLLKTLRNSKAVDIKTINMTQGQKESRFVAWTFLDTKQQRAWKNARWTQV